MKNTVTQPRVLGKVQSRSNPLKFYEIKLGGDGVVYCTCRAWITNKYCKHLEEWHSKNEVYTKTVLIKDPMLKFYEEQTKPQPKLTPFERVIQFRIIEGRWDKI